MSDQPGEMSGGMQVRMRWVGGYVEIVGVGTGRVAKHFGSIQTIKESSSGRRRKC